MLCDLGYMLLGDSLVRMQHIGWRRTEYLLLSSTLTIPSGVISACSFASTSRHSPDVCREQKMEVTFVFPEVPEYLVTPVFGVHRAR